MKKIYYLFFNFIFFANFFAMEKAIQSALLEITNLFQDKSEELIKHFRKEELINCIKRKILINRRIFLSIHPDKNRGNEKKYQLSIALVKLVNNYNDEWEKEERKKNLQPDSGEKENHSESRKKEKKNQVHIQDLKKNQIVRFDENKIQKLSIEQLKKFTSIQCSFFTKTQYQWFSSGCKKIIIAKIQELSNDEIKNMDIDDRNYWIKYFTRKQFEGMDEEVFKNISLLRVYLESIYCFFSEKRKKELTEKHINEIINHIKLNSEYYNKYYNKFWVDLVITEMFTEEQVEWIPKEDIDMVFSFIFKTKDGKIKKMDESKIEFIKKLSQEQIKVLPNEILSSICDSYLQESKINENRSKFLKNKSEFVEDSIKDRSHDKNKLLNNNMSNVVKQSTYHYYFPFFTFLSSSVLLLAPMSASLLGDRKLSPEFEVFIFKLENLIKRIKLDKFMFRWGQLIKNNKKTSIGVWSVITSICIGKWIQKKIKNNKLPELELNINQKNTKLNYANFNLKIKNNIDKAEDSKDDLKPI